jgi:hypothetical protein
VDKEFEKKSLKEIAAAPVSALQGLAAWYPLPNHGAFDSHYPRIWFSQGYAGFLSSIGKRSSLNFVMAGRMTT